ncbi:MAG TPA: AAA family ATPase, partial [Acidimicrobiales bacterium]|nr:AAA family ATPase [Acidimicrobiales bacterium]
MAQGATTGVVASRGPRYPSSKFATPKGPSGLVHRSRLFERLDRGADAQLTLVVGSPGAGKTVLLSDWLAARPERASAWVSCDVADADPVRFVGAIIEAVSQAASHNEDRHNRTGEDARQLLSLDAEVSADVVAALADDLEGPEAVRVLVVDDFHLAGGVGAEALALLAEYRPPSLQLVVGTRVDPPLRLHRMRASEQLVEVRDADLAFSVGEAKDFLAGLDVRLADEDVALVRERSEGWAAGLQMAALSLRSSPDPAGAAGRVELQRRSVAAYFLDEVLYRQPPEVADFMLATSVLDELSPAACTALCGEPAAGLLQRLYRGNLFVAVADEEASTFRYHHLIREVLRAELRAREPARERELHERTSRYLAGVGQVGYAARHLIAAGDPAAAFRILSERVILDFAANPTVGSALEIDEAQPDLFAGSPEILVPLAAELLLRGAFERGARAFRLAQETDIDLERQPELTVKMALVTSFYYMTTGQLVEGLAEGDEVRKLPVQTGPGMDVWLVALDALAMYSYALLGQVAEARHFADVVSSAAITPAPAKEVLCTGVKSLAVLVEGVLGEAAALADSSLASARRFGIEGHYFAFAATRTRALLALERRDLATAAEITERILGSLVAGRPIFDYLAQLDRARIWAAGGNFDEALASLPAARAALKSDRSVLLAQADELEARSRLALGDRVGAARVVERLPFE